MEFSKKYTLALIIPCYQEEKRLAKTFEIIKQAIETNTLDANHTALVFVNDGSTDKTKQMLENFAKDNESIYVVSNAENQGKGFSIKAGVAAVDADYYGFTDADLAYGLEKIPEAIQNLKSNDIAIGSRNLCAMRASYPLFRRLISRSLRQLTRLITGLSNHDTQCGFKFFTKKVAQEIIPNVHQNRFSFDIGFLALAKQKNIQIHEMKMEFTHDGDSSVRVYDGARYILDLLSVYDRLPSSRLRLYSLLIAIASFISFILFFWVPSLGSFFSDDFTWLWYGAQIVSDPSQVFSLQAASFFSPVMNLFYALLFGLLALSSSGFLWIGLLIHALVSFFSGLFAFKLTNSKLTAIFTTVLIAIAGSAYEPIVWIGANMHSITTLFILITLISYWAYLANNKSAQLIISFIALLLAFGTKEIAITLPPLLLLLLLFRKWQNNDLRFSITHILYISATTITTIGYLLMQLQLQNSDTVIASTPYNLHPAELLQYPFALLDLFIPFQAIDHLIPQYAAVALFVLLIAFCFFTLYRSFKKFPLGILSITFIIIAILPTIFFQETTFWEPLASRYTYLPRIGSALLIAGLLAHLIQKNTSRYIINSFAIILILISALQFSYMRSVTFSDYDYVYRTGSTLEHAATLIARDEPEKIFVHPEHPFRDNTAHIQGALTVFGDLSEDQIIFLTIDEIVETSPEQMLLYWNPSVPQYELTSKSDILYDYPW